MAVCRKENKSVVVVMVILCGFFLFFFSFSFSVFFVMFPFPSDESKTPKYIFPRVEERKILRIFFDLFLSVRKKENFLFFH